MTNLSVLNQFFNERIRSVDGNTKPLLQKLKSICERRASNQISEQKALLEIDKIVGNGSGFSPVINGLNVKNFNKPLNLFAGASSFREKDKKNSGLFDFNNVSKKEQFPVLGLRPVASNSNKKKFVLSPMSRSWFDVSKSNFKSQPVLNNFKKSQGNDKGLFSELVSTRVNDSNRAMKSLFDVSKSNFKSQPVLNNFKEYKNNSPLFGSSFVGAKSPRKGKRVYPKRNQSVAEMMGVKL